HKARRGQWFSANDACGVAGHIRRSTYEFSDAVRSIATECVQRVKPSTFRKRSEIDAEPGFDLFVKIACEVGGLARRRNLAEAQDVDAMGHRDHPAHVVIDQQ